MNVIKSNGEIEEFDQSKVKLGIEGAYQAIGEPYNEIIGNSIVSNLYVYENIKTSEIRRQIEESLMSINKKAAKCYIAKFDERDASQKELKKKSDFIREYIEASNAATGSKYDSNANVEMKNIVTLGQELYKGNTINQHRYIMQTKIRALYSKKLADQYLKDLESHVLYKHDESSGVPGQPYTYSGSEVIEVKIDNEYKILSLSELYSEFDNQTEVLVDPENNVYQKYPENLYVLDKENTWTKVSVLTKKERHRDLVYIKTETGEDLIVTDNHPMITDYDNIDSTVEAEKSLGATQFRTNNNHNFNSDLNLLKDCREVLELSEYSMLGRAGLLKMSRYAFLFGHAVVNDYNDETGEFSLKIIPNCKSNERTTKISKVVKITNPKILSENNYIYDITTETKTFSSNNLLVHNCVAISMYPFLTDGLTKLGGQSKAPTDLKSFCGEFINLVYSVSSQFLGACMHGNQTVAITEDPEDTHTHIITSKTLFEKYFNRYQTLYFSNSQGDWECIDIRDQHLLISENRKWTGLKKLYRRKYSDLIYKITSESGSVAQVSKDHIFNLLNNDRSIETKAKDLVTGDLVQTVTGPSKIKSIETFQNDLEYIYEVETETHWYNCGGFITHNCATPEFLMYMDYFIRKDYGEDYISHADEVVDLTSKKRTIGDVIDNSFQQVVHSMNMPAGNRGYQSVFWNIGYFDKPYFEGVFGDFKFPDGSAPKWETLSWLQKRFMNWFNTERTKYVLTFPVETMALLTDGHDGYLDEEYADFTAEMWSKGHSFFCYLSDSPDSLSSCCFEENQQITYRYLDNWFTELFKDAYDKLGDTREIFVKSYNPYTKERFEAPATLVKASTDILIGIRTESGNVFNVTPDHIFPVFRDGKIVDMEARSIKPTDQLLSNIGNPVKIIGMSSTGKLSTKQDVYCVQVKTPGNPYFILPEGIVTHNCRLRNSLKDSVDEDHNHTTHQYSMGTASVATGSKSVMTMNLPRIIQDATRKWWFEKTGEYLESGERFKYNLSEEEKNNLYEAISGAVREITERVHKYQNAFNETSKDYFKAGMLSVYSAGFIDLRKQYLTIGVNGLTDAAEFLGITVGPNQGYQEFVNMILETINVSNRKDRTRDCMFNTEFVPAENLAVKNYKWDKKDGYWVSPNRVLYSSYFYNPEDSDISALDKFKLHGKEYVQYLDGGSALHMNLQEHLSQPQYRQLMKVAANYGTNYFTFNVRNTVCNDCGYISKDTLTECPHCGSKNLDYLTRVIGYLKRISSFSEARQNEASVRHYHTDD